jgi:hypothetical protein
MNLDIKGQIQNGKKVSNWCTGGHFTGPSSTNCFFVLPKLQKQVMKTKSVEFMPFYLSLFSLLTSFMWTLYGVLGRDPYLTVSMNSGFASINVRCHVILVALFGTIVVKLSYRLLLFWRHQTASGVLLESFSWLCTAFTADARSHPKHSMILSR